MEAAVSPIASLCVERATSSRARRCALRSVMSRKQPTNRMPSPFRIGEIESSTGNSSPFFLRPDTSMRLPKTSPFPPSRYRRSPFLCASRYRAGMMRSAIVRPTASSCDHPNTFAARSFQSATTPSDCMTTTASRAVSKIRRSPSLAEDRSKRLDSALVVTDMLEPSLSSCARRTCPSPLLGRPPILKYRVHLRGNIPSLDDIQNDAFGSIRVGLSLREALPFPPDFGHIAASRRTDAQG